MKLKYYIRGVGIGILIATFLFTIANAVSSGKNTILQNNAATEPTSSVLAYTQAQTTAAQEESTKSEETTKEETTTKEQTTEETTQAVTQPETTIGAETQPEPEQQTYFSEMGDGQVQVYIAGGSTATEIAALLAEAGVIDDSEAFIHYMWENDKTSKLRLGNYLLKKGDDYANIAAQIAN